MPNFSTDEREIGGTYPHPISFNEAKDGIESTAKTSSHYPSFFRGGGTLKGVPCWLQSCFATLEIKPQADLSVIL